MKSFGMVLAPVLEPVGQQGGLAAAGVAEQHQRAAVAGRVAVERLEVVGPADVGAAADLGEGLVVAAPRGSAGRGCSSIGKLGLDGGLEIFEDEAASCARVGVVLAQRNVLRGAGRADERLERGLLVCAASAFSERKSAPRRLGVGRIAEVEERAPGHVGVVEHAVEDFQFGDALAVEVLEPRLLFPRGRR